MSSVQHVVARTWWRGIDVAPHAGARIETMLKGLLSNEPAPAIWVDYRILVDSKFDYQGFVSKYAQILMQVSLEKFAPTMFVLKKDVKTWAWNNSKFRIEPYSVGVPLWSALIEQVLEDLFPEVHCFEEVHQLQSAVQRNRHIIAVYSKDGALLGLDSIYRHFTGWSEVLCE